jgi:hypothetical protein
MSDEATLDTCGCCEGIEPLTPASIENPPGLSAIAYRIGTHATFKETMLAGLSRQRKLDGLTTRESDDPSIALVDAAATMLDVLTFYQERIANEGYLRTAAERRSILELARSIGYELSPGVAASTYLAFMLEDTPVTPKLVPIDKGAKVQSLPGPGEQPQTFETIERIEARREWNALKPQQTRPRYPESGDVFVYLEGTTTNLKPGDPILIVGGEPAGDPGSERWEFRHVAAVEPDAENNRTRVRCDEPLGSRVPHVDPPEKGPKVYTLRLRAALFGHNAPAWETLPVSLRVGERHPETGVLIDGAFKDRKNSWADATFAAETRKIHLDAVYSQITLDSWIVLASPTYAEVYRVRQVGEETKADFNLSAKVTELEISARNIGNFSPRSATVYGQSEEMPLAETPLLEDFLLASRVALDLENGTLTPLGGDRIVLDRLVEGLQKGQTLIVSGKLIRARVNNDRLQLLSADGLTQKPLTRGETLRVLEPPVLEGSKVSWRLEDAEGFGVVIGRRPPIEVVTVSWHVEDAEGFEGFIKAARNDFTLVSAAEDDPVVSEVVVLENPPTSEEKARTVLEFTDALAYVYDRATVRIHANVAKATHGETKRKVLGSGEAGQPFQRFALKQKPLTYVSAPTPSGRENTLEVRVNDIRWDEVPSLYARGPKDPIYTARLADDGTVNLQFGDGAMGTRLPTGAENVVATYRMGTGLAGLVKANQLSLLMTRPLGVKGVTNPLAPTGAANPEPRDQARRNAPFTVLTLDRIVSLKDYQDFTRAYAGIGKAQAVELRRGETRLVHITVAAADGGKVEPTSDLYKNLKAAIAAQSDEHQPFVLESYTPLQFNVEAKLRINLRYLPEKVLPAVRQGLLEAFSFEARSFGQPVTGSEVIAVMQRVEGVVSVDLDFLYFAKQSKSLPPDLRLKAEIARWDGSKTQPAELLTLNPNGIELREVKP